jgi:hypothetical protein
VPATLRGVAATFTAYQEAALAEETGIEAETLRGRRSVAERVPHGLRGQCATYSAYKEAAQAKDDARPPAPASPN